MTLVLSISTGSGDFQPEGSRALVRPNSHSVSLCGEISETHVNVRLFSLRALQGSVEFSPNPKFGPF